MLYQVVLHSVVVFSSLLVLAANGACAQVRANEEASSLPTLQGVWGMQSAYEILADGRRVTTYSEHPQGLLMIGRDGYYSLQIFHPNRRRLERGKAAASIDELKDAVIGSSTHFGRIIVDSTKMQLIFQIEAASFANWNGSTQIRDFEIVDGLLRYQVPATASPNGTIAYSIWKRIQ